jgi:MATE family multidrug resistance protein
VDNFVLVIFTVLTAISTATSILAAQEFGANTPQRAEAWRRIGLRLLGALLVVSAVPVLLAGKPLISLISADPVVVDRVWATLPIALFSLLPMLAGMSYSAVLRAAGNTRPAMIASIVGDYVMLVPLSWLLGITAGLGLPGIYGAWMGFGIVFSALLYLPHRRVLDRELQRPLTGDTS